MSMSRLFEDFGQQIVHNGASTSSLENADEIEEEKLKSFENGYGAGWDDAVKAQSETGQAVSDTLQKTLQAVAFTREEAFQGYLSSMRPLFEQIVIKVLPKLADQALLQNVVALLEQSLVSSSNLPVEIRVAPQHQVTVAKLTDGMTPEGSVVLGDVDLAPTEARITLGESETQIDLDGLVDDIHAAVSEFHISIKEGANDG